MPSDEKCEHFLAVFQNVNSWLHFSEAKNAALISFDIALLAVFFSFNIEDNLVFSFLFAIATITIMASIANGILSFLPQTTVRRDDKIEGAQKRSNLLFFEDIAKLEPKEYVEASLKDYFGEAKEMNNSIYLDYAEEIVINSRITVRKNYFFKRAAVYTALSLLCLLTVYLVGSINIWI